MSEVFGPIDYERMKRAVGRANRADKITINLAVAHAGFPDPVSLVADPTTLIPIPATSGLRITILAKGAGVFTLTAVFQDGSTIDLVNTELSNGDVLDWDFFQLYVTNAAQPGMAVTIIIEYRIIWGVAGSGL